LIRWQDEHSHVQELLDFQLPALDDCLVFFVRGSSFAFLGASSIFVSIPADAGVETESSNPCASSPDATAVVAAKHRALAVATFLCLSIFSS
jgi:hypothetical protein